MRQAIPFGKYLLLDRISVGGMAEVFKAKSYGVEGFEKVIAIKRILPSMGEDRDFIKMFIDEAKIVGQLAHANICQIFELGRTDGAHFIAMEYIWGKDLLQVQNRLRKLKLQMPAAMACFVVAKVCEGLDYAHKKRDALGRPLEIVHRDCSPQNVLISYEGEVKLIDFGIAKAASRSSRTQAGVLKGKFGYMSPEQVRGLPLDRRSDLFSVGTILYECLTGDRLFVGETDFSTLEKVRNVDVPRPRQINPDIPEAVEAIIMKALAKDAADRYQWGSEMVADLQRFLMTQEQVFTAKTLSAWLKDTFTADLERERAQHEAFKKLGREGLIAGKPQAEAKLDVVEHLGPAGQAEDPTMLGGPSFLDEEGSTLNTGAQPASVAAVDHAAEFAEEQKTEIYGEIGGPPGPAARPARPAVPSRPEDPTVSPLGIQDASLEAALAMARAQVVARHAPPAAPVAAPPAAAPPAPPPAGQVQRTVIGMAAPVAPPPAQPHHAGPAHAPGANPTLLAAGGLPAIPPRPGTATSPPAGPPGAGGYGPAPGQPGAGGYGAGGQPGPGGYGPAPGQPGGYGPAPGQPGGYGPAPGQPGFGPPPGPPGAGAYGGPAPGQPGYGPGASMPGYGPGASMPGYGPGASAPGGQGYYAPQLGMYGPSSGPPAATVEPPAKKRRPSLVKDVLIGVAIAGVALGGFAALKYGVLDKDDEPAAAAAAPAATGGLEIQLAEPGAPAEVFVDGATRGKTVDGKLALADLAPASYAVKVTRDGSPPCEGKVDVVAGQAAVFPCALVAAAPPPPDPAAAGDAGVDDGAVAVAALDGGDGDAAQVAALDPAAGSAAGSAVAGSGGSGGSGGSATTEPGAAPAAGSGSGSGDQGKVAVVEPAPPTPVPDPPKVEPKVDSKPKPDPKVDSKPKPDPKVDSKPKPDPKADSKPKPDPKADSKPRPDPFENKPKPDPKATAGAPGYLIASTTPWAQVAIDGKPTGKMTPITLQGRLELAPGPHKLTFTVGSDKFHFPIKIESGKTLRFTKDLPVEGAH